MTTDEQFEVDDFVYFTGHYQRELCRVTWRQQRPSYSIKILSFNTHEYYRIPREYGWDTVYTQPTAASEDLQRRWDEIERQIGIWEDTAIPAKESLLILLFNIWRVLSFRSVHTIDVCPEMLEPGVNCSGYISETILERREQVVKEKFKEFFNVVIP